MSLFKQVLLKMTDKVLAFCSQYNTLLVLQYALLCLTTKFIPGALLITGTSLFLLCILILKSLVNSIVSA